MGAEARAAAGGRLRLEGSHGAEVLVTPAPDPRELEVRVSDRLGSGPAAGGSLVGVIDRAEAAAELGVSDAAAPAKASVEIGPIVAKRVHECPSATQCFLTVRAPRLARAVRAGQFANLRADDRNPGFLPGYRIVDDWRSLRGSPNSDPEALHLTRLPMSVQRAFSSGDQGSEWALDPLLARLPRLLRHLARRPERDLVEFGLKVVGHGTRSLMRKEVGERLDLLGPLGLPAPLPLEYRRVLLVAGGIGLTALSLLAERLRARGDAVTLLVGARERAQLYPDPDAPGRLVAPEFEAMGVSVDTVFEEEEGRYVTDRLAQVLHASQGPRYDAVYTCGPWAMMARVSALCREASMPCWALLEKRMECGVGVCMSCVCRTRVFDGSGDWEPTRVCREGPTFDAARVVW